jgi:hypothetical protein
MRRSSIATPLPTIYEEDNPNLLNTETKIFNLINFNKYYQMQHNKQKSLVEYLKLFILSKITTTNSYKFVHIILPFNEADLFDTSHKIQWKSWTKNNFILYNELLQFYNFPKDINLINISKTHLSSLHLPSAYSTPTIWVLTNKINKYGIALHKDFNNYTEDKYLCDNE